MNQSLRCKACNRPLTIDDAEDLCEECYGMSIPEDETDEEDEPQELFFE